MCKTDRLEKLQGLQKYIDAMCFFVYPPLYLSDVGKGWRKWVRSRTMPEQAGG